MYKRMGTSASARRVLPKLNKIKDPVSLSKEAKQRLKWMDYYQAHDENARLTCRHFGIHHRTFYRYYKRFKEQGLVGLENLSKRPLNLRQPTTPQSNRPSP